MMWYPGAYSYTPVGDCTLWEYGIQTHGCEPPPVPPFGVPGL
jgi:hypothetical protein